MRDILYPLNWLIPQNPSDKFLYLVISSPENGAQLVYIALRIYNSEISIDSLRNPLEALEKFVDHYCIKVNIGKSFSKLIQNEVIANESIHFTPDSLSEIIRPLEGDPNNRCCPVVIASESKLRGANNEMLIEIELAFLLDIERYMATLKRHNVKIYAEIEFPLLRIFYEG